MPYPRSSAGLVTASPSITLRPSPSSEHDLRYDIIEAAWRVAYAHIYTPKEIDDVFAGNVATFGDWVDDRVRTYGYWMAEADGEAVGVLGLAARQPPASSSSDAADDDDEADDIPLDGEIASLYVLPDWQGRGVGMMMWEYGCATLQEYNHQSLWVYTIGRAPATHFYESRGCTVRDEAVYTVGKHRERALGYWLALGDGG